jgi:lysozyme family protein
MAGSVETYLERLINQIIAAEGGYSDHPDDLGGPTCWGITESVARGWGYRGLMQDLPQETAREIYRERYFYGPHFDRVAAMSPAIGHELTDTGVNMGTAQAGAFLQSALNALNHAGQHYPDLVVDGQIGTASLGALRAYLDRRGAEGERVMLVALNALQGARYIELAEARERNEAFVYGWLRARVAMPAE